MFPYLNKNIPFNSRGESLVWGKVQLCLLHERRYFPPNEEDLSSAELIKSRKSFTISVWRIYKPIRVFERQFWSCSSLKNWNPLPTHMGYLSDWALRASVMLIGQELWFVIFFFSFIIFCRLNVFFLPFLPAAGQAENILPNKDLIWQFVDGILVLPS